MDERRTNLRNLNPHHEIPNAFVSTPIADWSDDDVWLHLFENNPPPWGTPHDRMLTLYRQALGGECPVVMDLNTPSCGGSRFGCWVCTVVKVDKSMEGFIQSGEDWMKPRAGFRDWLKAFREQPGVRMEVRRDGSKGPGPFTPKARQEILKELLEREAEVGIPLISDQELRYIQAEWSREFDLKDSALALARRVGRELEMGEKACRSATPTGPCWTKSRRSARSTRPWSPRCWSWRRISPTSTVGAQGRNCAAG